MACFSISKSGRSFIRGKSTDDSLPETAWAHIKALWNKSPSHKLTKVSSSSLYWILNPDASSGINFIPYDLHKIIASRHPIPVRRYHFTSIFGIRNVIKKNFYLHHVALVSNNQSERSTTDHQNKRVGKGWRTEPQTTRRHVLTCVMSTCLFCKLTDIFGKVRPLVRPG